MVGLKLLSLSVLLTLVLVFLPVTAIHAQEKVANSYFSIKIPDTWTYVKTLGTGGPSIYLAPSEFGSLLNPPKEGQDDKKLVDFVLSLFRQDTTYNVKNAPLDAYVKNRIDDLRSEYNISSTFNGAIGNEKAVKLTKIGIGEKINSRVVEYLMLHKREPYIITYSADTNHFDKYLPEFEQLVRSFKFVN